MSYPENMTLQATVELPGKVANEKASLLARFEWPGRIALLAAVVISPWLYGGYQFSTQTGIAVALLIGLASWWFETAISEKKSLVFAYVFFPVAIGLLLIFFQLWALPQWLGDMLLGRQVEIFKEFGNATGSTPSISVAPESTWTYLGMLLLGISGLCLGCHYFRRPEHMKLLFAVCTINGAAIAIFGIIQAMTTTTPDRIYWVVELVYGGAPFGPYVNRNSCAGYLLICLGCSLGLITMELAPEKSGPKALGTKDLPFWRQFKLLLLRFVAGLDARKIACLMAAMLIAVGIIASLSRGGVLSMLVAATFTLFAYGMARKPDFTGFIFLPAVLLVVGLASWLGFSEQLLKRVDNVNVEQISETDIRMRHWLEMIPAIGDTGVLGSGAGSYAGIHRIYRTEKEVGIFLHGESQYVQTIIELGWPGLILLLISWALVLYYSTFALFKGNSPSTIAAGTAGSFAVVGVALASAFDFGLYMPANLLLMAVISGLLAYQSQSLAGRLRAKSWLRFETPRLFVQLAALVLFAALFAFALDFYRRAGVESAIREFPIAKFSYDYPKLEDTNRLIEEIAPRVQNNRTIEGLNYVGRLFEHRFRLQLMEELAPGFNEKKLDEEELLRINNYWLHTQLDLVQEHEFYLRRDKSPREAAEFRNKPYLRDNLPMAVQYWEESRRISPLQPFVHLKVAQVNAIVGSKSEGARSMENATRMAPMNSTLRKQAQRAFNLNSRPSLLNS